MAKYQCPVCGKSACDTAKSLSLARLSSNNEEQADVVIKCQCCKSTLAVNITQNFFVIEHMSSPQRINTNKP